MKRLPALLLSLMLCAFIGTGRAAEKPSRGFRGDETAAEQTLFEAGGLTVAVKGLGLVSDIPVLALAVTNASGRELRVEPADCTLNGWMWNAGIVLYQETPGEESAAADRGTDRIVPDGETKALGIGFAGSDDYEPCGIKAFSEIGFVLRVSDARTGGMLLTTPRLTVNTSVPMAEADGFEAPGRPLYDQNGLRLFCLDVRPGEGGGSAVPVLIVNRTDRPVSVSVPSLRVNGAETGSAFGTVVPAGCRCRAEVWIGEAPDRILDLSLTVRMEELILNEAGEPAGGADAVECLFETTREEACHE